MLAVNNLNVKFGSLNILNQVGFNAHRGETLAILGRNGAGKSTIIKSIAGLINCNCTLRLDNKDITSHNPVARSKYIGYAAQTDHFNNVKLTTFELLLLAQQGRFAGWSVQDECLQSAIAMLSMLGIEDLAHQYPEKMSGGQRQLVSLALALISAPEILLLDEPTSALDIANQIHLLSVVANYTREKNIITIAVLHDLNLASQYADRSILLHNGGVFAEGNTAEVLNNDNISQVYGVQCEILSTSGLNLIFPVSISHALAY